MNIRRPLAIIVTAASLASCVYPPPPRRPQRPQTGASLDRPASGERSSRETRYLEEQASQPQASQPPPGSSSAEGGIPPQDTAAVQAPNNTPPPVTAEAPLEKPKTEAPKEAPAPAPAPAASELPYGKPVPGKKGFVYSPYDQSAGFVDVRDISPGTKVRCPYTGKIFRVP